MPYITNGKRNYKKEYAALLLRRKNNEEYDSKYKKDAAARVRKSWHKNKTPEKLAAKRAYTKEYSLKYPERIKLTAQKTFQKHKEKRIAYSRKYNKKNKEKIAKQTKAYRLQHKEYLRAWAKEYGKKNTKKLTKKYLERLKTDPNFRLICYARNRMGFFLKGRKSKTTMELLGVPNLDFLWQHLETQFQPGMTRENYGKWHVDHIIPCASFDFSEPEQHKKCFHYTNLQPLWAHDNLSKGNKIISGDIISPKM
jgi:hypothetical protein